MKEDYPHWKFQTRKDWLKSVRKRWFVFRKIIKKSDVETGCAFYPPEVYTWLNQFDQIDKIMKKFYKNI